MVRGKIQWSREPKVLAERMANPGFGLLIFISLMALAGLKLRRHMLHIDPSTHLRIAANDPVQANSLSVSMPDHSIAEAFRDPHNSGVTYETLTLPKSIVHVVRIPTTSPVTIRPAIALDGLEKLETLAQQEGAIAAINGGFFDPNNQLTTSYVTRDGEVVLDPRDNIGLMENLNVAIYIDRILNRSEFRRYQCSTEDERQTNYVITPHDQLTPFHCELVDALGAGPALLPQFRAEDEAFVDEINGRDALGSNYPNARSAIGIAPDGTVVLAMAAQRADVSDRSGLSLFELADVMASLGVDQALNLDGGSSSSLYYDGTTHYGRLDADNNVIKRSVKSVLLVLPTESSMSTQ